MSKGLESDLRTQIRKELNKLPKCRVWTQTAGKRTHKRNISDIIGFYNGYFVALEVKLDRKKYDVTDGQSLFLQEVKRSGGIAGAVTSVEEAVEVLRKYGTNN